MTKTNIKTILFSVFFIFWNLTVHSQSKEIKKIDNGLLYGSGEMVGQGKLKEAVKFNQKLIEDSKKADYLWGVVKGYCNLASILGTLGKTKESFSLLDLAKKENEKLSKDRDLSCLIFSELAKNYYNIGMYSQSIEYCKKSLAKINNLADVSQRKPIKEYCYSILISDYSAQNNADSQFHYTKMSFDEQKTVYNSTALAYAYIYCKKNMDSAKYYLKFAEKENKKYSEQQVFNQYIIFWTWGEFFSEKKEYDSAQIYYKKSLQYAEKMKSPLDEQRIYLRLFNIAKFTNEKGLSADYLQKYSTISDSLAEVQVPKLEISLQHYIKEKQDEYKDKEYRLYYLIALIILLASIFTFGYIRIKRKKEKSLEERLLKNREILKEKEEETLLLKDKVNESFDEVIRLAKNNDPEFPVKFRILFPEFCEALTKIYPDINNDTLKFCALIKLNFSTKNIAEYTFVTIRAVQIRKTRLRKKLNIPSDEDIYLWINNLK